MLLARVRPAILAFAIVLFGATAATADPSFPALTGRVVDQAELLPPDKQAAIEAKLAQLEADTGDQLVVVTLNSLQNYEIEDYGYRLGRAWGIGSAENDTGALLIVAPNERKVRIEVGYGLEPVLTDALSNQIIQSDILPAFRDGSFSRGISAGVDAIDAQLRLDPVEARSRAQEATSSAAEGPVFPALIVGLIFLFLFLNLLRGGRGRRRRRGPGGVGPVLLWSAMDALGSSSRGGGGSSFGGGGGFSGGGGSFGGGGASGGW